MCIHQESGYIKYSFGIATITQYQLIVSRWIAWNSHQPIVINAIKATKEPKSEV